MTGNAAYIGSEAGTGLNLFLGQYDKRRLGWRRPAPTGSISAMPLCESFSDFVDLVVPELQRRGVYKQVYHPETLREKLLPALGAKLPASHPAAAFRHAAAAAEATD